MRYKPEYLEKDLCLTCGKEVPHVLYSDEYHDAVHQIPCSYCGRLCGLLLDDDTSHPEKIICPECLNDSRRVLP